jgi:hypothetical protein
MSDSEGEEATGFGEEVEEVGADEGAAVSPSGEDMLDAMAANSLEAEDDANAADSGADTLDAGEVTTTPDAEVDEPTELYREPEPVRVMETKPLGDGTYHGEVVDGKANGEGSWTGDPDSKFAGCQYAGKFKDDCFLSGKYIMRNGARYEGEWCVDASDIYSLGLKHGKGKYTAADEAVYEGEYSMGKKHGAGTYKYASGAQYIGAWEGNSKHGFGRFHYENGDVYSGDWELNKQHGEGEFKYTSNGNQYKGEFQNGKYHGTGSFSHANGGTYEGGWLKGARHGQGRMTWGKANAAKFVGEFRNGKRNGEGAYTNIKGVTVKGVWKDDKQIS